MITRTVESACPTCGPVDVSADAVMLIPCVGTLGNIYRFRCPLCSAWLMRIADPKIVARLLRAGAGVDARAELLGSDMRIGRSEFRIIDSLFGEALQHWLGESA